MFNRLAGGLVPVPAVIHAEPYGLEGLPPFTLARYVEGISLRDLRRSGDAGAIAGLVELIRAIVEDRDPEVT